MTSPASQFFDGTVLGAGECLIAHIFSFLTLRDVVNMRSVSKSLKDIIDAAPSKSNHMGFVWQCMLRYILVREQKDVDDLWYVTLLSRLEITGDKDDYEEQNSIRVEEHDTKTKLYNSYFLPHDIIKGCATYKEVIMQDFIVSKQNERILLKKMLDEARETRFMYQERGDYYFSLKKHLQKNVSEMKAKLSKQGKSMKNVMNENVTLKERIEFLESQISK